MAGGHVLVVIPQEKREGRAGDSKQIFQGNNKWKQSKTCRMEKRKARETRRF
jgi:hypothetical protein